MSQSKGSSSNSSGGGGGAVGPNNQLAVVLDSIVKFQAQTAGKDKVAKLLQYGGKFIAAWAAGRAAQGSELAQKAKKIEGAASAARKVFRLGNELAELQKIRTIIRSSKLIFNPSAWLQLSRSVGMYWYWVFDHLNWAASLGLAKLDGPKYAYYGALAWTVGLISTILIDLQALNKALNPQEWNSSSKPQSKEAVPKKEDILLNCVKNFADLGIAANLIKVADISQAKIGVLGVLSALIGAYQVYPRPQ